VVKYFDLDAVGFSGRGLLGYRIETLDASHFRNQWGTICRVTSEYDGAHPVEGAIKTEKDLDTRHPPDLDEPWRYEKLAELVKRCIKQAALGGGYICMSSNSIHSAVKPENYVEMVKAIRDYGKYPISI